MIKVGDHLPKATFTISTADGPKAITTDEIFAGKTVIIFGVPGAFTPTCHRNHLPGFRDKAAELKARGVDSIAVVSVNDVFVMNAWAEATNAKDAITFLADGSAKFTNEIGLSIDLTERGLGIRSQRYSMLVEDGVVRKLNVEETVGTAELSGAEAMLAAL